jgi:hypothetical protein
MSTCPTNPQYQPPSRDTTNSCGINNDGINNDIKIRTNTETYAYIIRNPRITRSCDYIVYDSGDDPDYIVYDSDDGNDPKVIPIDKHIGPIKPLFPTITQDIINDAMNLVAKNDVLVHADTGNISNPIDNGAGSVCQYKPIKF